MKEKLRVGSLGRTHAEMHLLLCANRRLRRAFTTWSDATALKRRWSVSKLWLRLVALSVPLTRMRAASRRVATQRVRVRGNIQAALRGLVAWADAIARAKDLQDAGVGILVRCGAQPGSFPASTRRCCRCFGGGGMRSLTARGA